VSRLPNVENAIIEDRKLLDYLLSETHEDGKHKARAFLSMGFTRENFAILAAAVRILAASGETAEVEATEHGRRYRTEGEIEVPRGGKVRVRLLWIIDAGSDIPRLVSAYPAKREP